jgi:flagellin
MAIYVNTNVQSIFAQRALGGNTFDLQKSIEKLSTGYRINRASDDAAGLSISEKLTSQIRGLEKAEQNIGDGISMVQTAEGALSIVQDNVQRIRELVVQGLNGTNSANELDAIQREINARVGTIRDIGTDTEFNGLSLLTGGAAAATVAGDTVLQTGADQGQTTTVSLQAGTATANQGIGVDVTVGSAGGNAEHGHLTEGVQDGAGAAFTGFALGEIHLAGATVDSYNVANGLGGANIDIVSNPAAGTLGLGAIDTVLDNISRMRSELGAVQNSLESKAEYLNVAKENAMSSRSRIKDVDVAKESSAMVKSQILQQTSAAMLSQANQTPQLALNLLP